MPALRIATEAVPRDETTSSAPLYDTLGDDTPRGLYRDLEEAETARTQAALDAFEDGLYADGADAGGGPEDADEDVPPIVGGTVFKPQRARADRQTTRPLREQIEEWRGMMPHARVRGVAVGVVARDDAVDATDLEGVQFIPREARGDDDDAGTSRPAETSAPAPAAAAAATPWLAALDGGVREWWGRASDAPGLEVIGHACATRKSPPPPPPEEEEEETFAEDGTIEEIYAGGADESASDPVARELSAVLDARRDHRRFEAGLPSLDPLEVIALDVAFDRGEVKAGEVEPAPKLGDGDAQVIVFDDEHDDDDEYDDERGGARDEVESAYEFGGEGFAEEPAYEYTRSSEKRLDRSREWPNADDADDDGAPTRESSPEPNPWPEVAWGGGTPVAAAAASAVTRAARAARSPDWSDAGGEEARWFGGERAAAAAAAAVAVPSDDDDDDDVDDAAPGKPLADWLLSDEHTSLTAAPDVVRAMHPVNAVDAVARSAMEWGWGNGPSMGSGSIGDRTPGPPPTPSEYSACSPDLGSSKRTGFTPATRERRPQSVPNVLVLDEEYSACGDYDDGEDGDGDGDGDGGGGGGKVLKERRSQRERDRMGTSARDGVENDRPPGRGGVASTRARGPTTTTTAASAFPGEYRRGSLPATTAPEWAHPSAKSKRHASIAAPTLPSVAAVSSYSSSSLAPRAAQRPPFRVGAAPPARRQAIDTSSSSNAHAAQRGGAGDDLGFGSLGISGTGIATLRRR